MMRQLQKECCLRWKLPQQIKSCQSQEYLFCNLIWNINRPIGCHYHPYPNGLWIQWNLSLQIDFNFYSTDTCSVQNLTRKETGCENFRSIIHLSLSFRFEYFNFKISPIRQLGKHSIGQRKSSKISLITRPHLMADMSRPWRPRRCLQPWRF